MEARDPAIRLFGKEIALPENGKIPAVSGGDCWVEGGCSDNDLSSVVSTCLEDKKVSRTGDEEPEDEEKKEVEAADKENFDPETLPELEEENPKTPSIEEETGSSKPPECESNDQTDASNSWQQKALKKPDKILPCPRCNSMDTKFCYFNNYNVNQPRHFCKSCQRYWTNGGTMRNVPIGAGRRKNKNSSASHHCRRITFSEALQVAQTDPPNGIHNPAVKSGRTVLNFGPEAPLCESMASVLNLAENMAAPSGVWNGFYRGENGNDCYGGSPVTSSNSMEEGMRKGNQDPMIEKLNEFTSQMTQSPCVPGIPWPYPWNSAVPVPAFCPSGYPIPFYTAPYWNCGVPNGWSVPWLSPPVPATSPKAPSSAPNSPLGKHSRYGDLIKPSSPDGKEEAMKHNNSILVPKTLRIDDPDEAAKSSIWATLGIKNDSVGLFKAAFQPKGAEKNLKCETHPALRANPAAMSRSLSFQEGA